MYFDENGRSVRIATAPRLFYMYTYFSQKSVSGIASKLFLQWSYILFPKTLFENIRKEYPCSDKKDSLSFSILKVFSVPQI